MPFPLTVDSVLDQLAPTPETAIVLVDDSGEIVAFGQVLFNAPHPRAHLARLIVDPERRGQGWGRRLATALMAQAPEASDRYFTLNVIADNGVAISLYKSLGFGVVERPADAAGSSDSLFMKAGHQQLCHTR